MKKLINSHLKFETTGRSFYANGYIGIMEQKDGTVCIAEGYDGHINIEGEEDEELTDKERMELADYMIELWKKFKL